MAKPYYTSDDLIESVKRKISFPFDQNTFSDEDILKFANEEMFISQVPSVMQYHEEYFTYQEDRALEDGRKKYPIPERAIANKLRDIFYVDSQDNEFEMTQVMRDDRTHFADNYSVGNLHKFYFEGDGVVLVTGDDLTLTGALRFDFYLRPNSLVETSRAAICTGFSKTVVVDNATLVVGDVLTVDTINFTAGTEFAIGASSVETATNLANAITSNGVASANNGTVSTSTVTILLNNSKTAVSSEATGLSVQSTRGIVVDKVPTNIAEGTKVDFLQTRGAHKTYNYDVSVGSGAISGLTISFNETDINQDFVIGDYICSEFECIIPQIPDDLHTALSERTCSRILSAIGDMNGLKATNEKINEIEARQGTLMDNRGEGTPQKVMNTHSHIRYGKRRRMTRRH